MRYLLSLLFVAAWLACPAQSTKDIDEEDPYYLLSGQADKAIADGDYESAAARLLEAMSIRPDAPENVMLLSNLGMVYSYLDRDSLALATLTRALDKAPSMRTVLANRAHVLLKMGRDPEARADLDRLVATPRAALCAACWPSQPTTTASPRQISTYSRSSTPRASRPPSARRRYSPNMAVPPRPCPTCGAWQASTLSQSTMPCWPKPCFPWAI